MVAVLRWHSANLTVGSLPWSSSISYLWKSKNSKNSDRQKLLSVLYFDIACFISDSKTLLLESAKFRLVTLVTTSVTGKEIGGISTRGYSPGGWRNYSLWGVVTEYSFSVCFLTSHTCFLLVIH